MYCLTILEARSLKPRCQEGQNPSELDKGASFLASVSFEWLQTNLGIPSLVNAIILASVSIIR